MSLNYLESYADASKKPSASYGSIRLGERFQTPVVPKIEGETYVQSLGAPNTCDTLVSSCACNEPQAVEELRVPLRPHTNHITTKDTAVLDPWSNSRIPVGHVWNVESGK